MALIDHIEMLGTAADEGLIDREEAAVLLAELSEGGLTLVGARSAIATHRGLRDRYAAIFVRSARAVEVLTAVTTAETPEEKYAAEAARIAWTDQEVAAMRDDLFRRSRRTR